MKKMIALFSSVLLVASFSLFAEETVGEKVQIAAEKGIDATKEAGRKAEDKGCEMIKGEKKCAPKKLKHKAKTAVEKAETKAKEIKNKID